MGIKANFTKDDVRKRFDAFLNMVEQKQIERLQRLGEMCLIEARNNKGYMMQTGLCFRQQDMKFLLMVLQYMVNLMPQVGRKVKRRQKELRQDKALPKKSARKPRVLPLLWLPE